MERSLPIYKIEGTAFIVNAAKDEIMQLSNPLNVIGFSQMRDMGTHYILLYDLVRKTKPMPPERQEFGGNVIEVEIPPLLTLDREGMAAKYGMSVEDTEGKTDYEVIIDQDQLKARLEGTLPEIEIANEKYVVNMDSYELILKKDQSTVISLHDLWMNEEGTEYWGFYNTKARNMVSIDSNVTEFPADVVMVTIPDEFTIDPVYVGKSMEMILDLKPFLRSWPLQRELKARITPLRRTFIAEVIKSNKARLKQKQNSDKLRNGKQKKKM